MCSRINILPKLYFCIKHFSNTSIRPPFEPRCQCILCGAVLVCMLYNIIGIGRLWILISNISYMLGITLFQALARLTPLFTLLYEVQLRHTTAWPSSYLFTDTCFIQLLRNILHYTHLVCINKFNHTLNNCINVIIYIFYSLVIALLLYLQKCVFITWWLTVYNCRNWSLFDIVILVHGYEKDKF